MSFAQLKKSSQVNFKQLAEKMGQEGKSTSYEDKRFWYPDIDKTGNAFAVIRFLPSTENAEFPYVKTYSHGFKIGTKWYIENCPTTIGQPCPCCEANSELWNTEIKENQEIVRKRKRRIHYISNIMVLNDSKHPENEGQVRLFKYGAKIFAKLMNAINPEFEDEKPFNPFDFWEGAPFKLKIRNVEGYRNYDKSEFGDCEPLFPTDEALEEVWKSEFDLSEFIQENQFKPYAELKKKLALVLNSSYISNDESNETDGSLPTEEPKVQQVKEPVKSSVKTAVDDDDDFALFSSLIDE